MFANLTQYNKSIDGLRAIAVLSVIINHLKEPLLPGGYLGVDVFFVISGFVITTSIYKKRETNVWSFFIGFYKRRVKRLYPALLFVFSITALLISFFSKHPTTYIRTGLISIPGFSNIYLYFRSTDYWSESAKLNPFTHTWSLGVEEQFYFIFPLIIFLTTGLKWSKNGKMTWVVLSILSFISVVAFLIYLKPQQDLVYYMIPFRFWEIGVGCLLFLILNRMSKVPRFNRIHLLLVLLMIVLVFFIPKEYQEISTLAIVVLTLFSIFIVKSMDEFPHEKQFNILTHRFLIHIGTISYSLYLWHWVIIVLNKWTLNLGLLYAPFLFLLMYIFAYSSYRFIENPLRHISWRSSFKSKVILGSFTIIWGLFFIGELSHSGENELYLGKRPSTYSTKFLNSLNNESKFSSIRLLGNSHSNHIIPVMNLIAKKTGSDLIYERSPNFIDLPSGTLKEIDRIDDIISSLSENDILILSSRYRYLYQQPYLNGQGNKWIDHTEEKIEYGYGLNNWLKELDLILEKTALANINVVLILPSVEFDKPVLKAGICSEEWFRKPNSDCFVKVKKEYLNNRFPKEYFTSLEKRVQSNRNFYLFDPLPIYCEDDAEECTRVVNGIIAYGDTNHYNSDGALMMLDSFLEFLVKNELW